jgi:hypothetical protein
MTSSSMIDRASIEKRYESILECYPKAARPCSSCYSKEKLTPKKSCKIAHKPAICFFRIVSSPGENSSGLLGKIDASNPSGASSRVSSSPSPNGDSP